VDDTCFNGTTVRISEEGVFVRSQKCFTEGTPVGIRLELPGGEVAALKGTVKYARIIDFLPRQNGMGIEFTEKDDAYLRFIRGLETG